MNRRDVMRGLLFGSVASLAPVGLLAPAFAQAAPAMPIPEVFTRTARNSFLRHNPTMTKAQIQTALGAVNDNLGGPTGQSMLRRIAPLMIRRIPIVAAIEVVAAGVGLWTIYDMISGDGGGLPDYGVVKFVPISGQMRPSITTFETGVSSSWSMVGQWSVWLQSARSITAASGLVQAGWDVTWLWNPPNNPTYQGFNPTIHVDPFRQPVGDPLLEDYIRRQSDFQLGFADLSGLVDQAIAVAAAANPGAFPPSYANPATRPRVQVGDLPDFPQLGRSPTQSGQLLLPAPPSTPVFDPGNDPVLDQPGMDSNPNSWPPGWPNTSGNPNPNPDPNPNPNPNPNPGDPGTGGGIAPGEEIDPDAVGEFPGFEAFVNPFRTLFDPFAAVYDAGAPSCPNFTMPTIEFGQFGSMAGQTFDFHCQVIEPFRPVIVAASGALGGWAAVSHIMEA